MKDREIFERTIPEPTTLLGLKLLPLSLGHIILLHRIESAFVLGGKPSYDDLATSVFICSRTYQDAVDGFSDPSLPRQMHRWARKLTGSGWFRKGKPINLSEKWKAFDDYLDRNTLIFKSGKDYAANGEGRKVYLPMVHSIRVKLQSRMHFSDADILDRSWALCILDYHILCDMDGHIQLTDEDVVKNLIADTQAIGDRVAEIFRQKGMRINGR